ncbi:MAG TPA: PASTA domain-containing protein, partial [Coriobacteriia bacterium]|nr:PASTA domain-containing protein [Coriobacteriia bacterium]
AGLTADVVYVTTAEEATGTVIGQDPEPGRRVLGDAVVTLTIAGAEMLEVPDLVGMDEAAAKAAIVEAGFVVGEVGQEFNAAVSLRAVISQSPRGATQAPRGGAIELTISKGTELIAVPGVVGMTQAEAEKALTDVGLEVDVQTATSGDAAPGAVVSQSPEAGIAVDAGTLVTLQVRADAAVAVPNVVGMTRASAEKKLTDAGFDVRTQTAQSTSVQEGSVISQSPEAGSTAKEGAVVTLRVSGGVPTVRVPNVVRMSRSRAEATLQNAGLGVRIRLTSSSTVPEGDVVSQSPSAGSTVDEGTVITVRVSLGVSTVQVPNVVHRSQVDAERILRAAGLVPQAVWPGGTPPDDADPEYSEVVGQNPGEGSTVPAGSVVRINLIG